MAQVLCLLSWNLEHVIELQVHSRNYPVQMNSRDAAHGGRAPHDGRGRRPRPAANPIPRYGPPISRDPALRLTLPLKLELSVFEFAAVLFLASIFHGTLLPMSVYALVRSGAAIMFGQPIGSLIDRGNRLAVVRASIIGGRLAIAASCGLFWALERRGQWVDEHLKERLFALTVVLACVEKLCTVMNVVSVERDWVVVITEGNESARRGSSTT